MSLLYHEIKSKLNEMDHETKPEDYTNASSSFDDIFLDGDYLYSNLGTRVTYKIIDDNNHQLLSDEGGDYNAFSNDGYHWKIALRRQPVDEVEGKPVDVAKYICNLNDTVL